MRPQVPPGSRSFRGCAHVAVPGCADFAAGGAGEVFTSDAQGGVTIDTHAARPVVFKSAGETFSASVSGTGRGSLTTATLGPDRVFDFKPSADDTRKTLSLDSTGTELGPAR